jgi:hypothetical protein
LKYCGFVLILFGLGTFICVLKKVHVIFYKCDFFTIPCKLVRIESYLGLFLGSWNFVKDKELMCLLLILSYVLQRQKKDSRTNTFIIYYYIWCGLFPLGLRGRSLVWFILKAKIWNVMFVKQ